MSDSLEVVLLVVIVTALASAPAVVLTVLSMAFVKANCCEVFSRRSLVVSTSQLRMTVAVDDVTEGI